MLVCICCPIHITCMDPRRKRNTTSAHLLLDTHLQNTKRESSCLKRTLPRHSADCLTTMINKLTSLRIAWLPRPAQCAAGVGGSLQASQMAGLAQSSRSQVAGASHKSCMTKLKTQTCNLPMTVLHPRSRCWNFLNNRLRGTRCTGGRGMQHVHGRAHAHAMPTNSMDTQITPSQTEA